LNINFDKDGLIYVWTDDYKKFIQVPDYGDTCAENFRYFHLIKVREHLGISNSDLPFSKVEDVRRVFSLCRISPGVFARAPVSYLPAEWGDPAKDFSRDQHVPMLMALSAWGLEDEYKEAVSGIRRRFGFFQNGDFPTCSNLYRRCEKRTPWAVLDSVLWIDTLARCGKLPTYNEERKDWRWGDPGDVANDLNLAHSFMQSWYRGETRVSYSALRYYYANRVQIPESSEKNRVMQAIALYYKNSNPGLIEVYRPVVESIFREQTLKDLLARYLPVIMIEKEMKSRELFKCLRKLE